MKPQNLNPVLKLWICLLLLLCLAILTGCQTKTGYAPNNYDPTTDPKGEQIITPEQYQALPAEEQAKYSVGVYKEIQPAIKSNVYQGLSASKEIIEAGAPYLPSPIKDILLLVATGLGIAGTTWQTVSKRKIWQGFTQTVASVDKVLDTSEMADKATGLTLSLEQLTKIKALLSQLQDSNTQILVDKAQLSNK